MLLVRKIPRNRTPPRPHFMLSLGAEALGCPVDGALPELAFIVSLQVCLGYHETFFYTSQDLSVLEPIKWERVPLVTVCVPQHQAAGYLSVELDPSGLDLSTSPIPSFQTLVSWRQCQEAGWSRRYGDWGGEYGKTDSDLGWNHGFSAMKCVILASFEPPLTIVFSSV